MGSEAILNTLFFWMGLALYFFGALFIDHILFGKKRQAALLLAHEEHARFIAEHREFVEQQRLCLNHTLKTVIELQELLGSED